MPPQLHLSFVLLLPLSQGQRVEVGDGQGHTFTYTAKSDAPITTAGLPGLSQAARRGCKAQQLAVSLDECTQFVVRHATQKVVEARAAQGSANTSVSRILLKVECCPSAEIQKDDRFGRL